MFKTFMLPAFSPPDFIAKYALVNLNSSGIVGSTPVTRWSNSGTGGSAYDLSVVGGTGANLTRTTLNGLDAVNAAGSVYMETATGQTIASGAVVFAVAQFTNAAPGDQQDLFSAKSNGALQWKLSSVFSASNKFGIYQGGAGYVTLNEAYDTSLHVHTAQFNGGASTSYAVSGLGNKTGNAGTANWDAMTLFAAVDGSLTFAGNFCELIVLPTNPGATIIAAINAYLAAKWGAA